MKPGRPEKPFPPLHATGSPHRRRRAGPITLPATLVSPPPVRIQAFTLLEVLAAVLIFSLAITVLIGTSSAGVRMASLTADRMEASLVAEAELARLESRLNTQRTPPEDSETTTDRFSVRMYSEPAIGDFGGGASLPGAEGTSGLAAILAVEAPGAEQFLRRYEIRVEWLDGAHPRQVQRTTYGFDWEGAREALPDLFQGGIGADDDTGDDQDAQDPSANSGSVPRLPSLGGQ